MGVYWPSCIGSCTLMYARFVTINIPRFYNLQKGYGCCMLLQLIEWLWLLYTSSIATGFFRILLHHLNTCDLCILYVWAYTHERIKLKNKPFLNSLETHFERKIVHYYFFPLLKTYQRNDLFVSGCHQHGNKQERWKRHPLRDSPCHHGYRFGIRIEVSMIRRYALLFPHYQFIIHSWPFLY